MQGNKLRISCIKKFPEEECKRGERGNVRKKREIGERKRGKEKKEEVKGRGRKREGKRKPRILHRAVSIVRNHSWGGTQLSLIREGVSEARSECCQITHMGISGKQLEP